MPTRAPSPPSSAPSPATPDPLVFSACTTAATSSRPDDVAAVVQARGWLAAGQGRAYGEALRMRRRTALLAALGLTSAGLVPLALPAGASCGAPTGGKLAFAKPVYVD